MPVLIEACVESVDVAIAATQAGADRIELNCGMDVDGLTPTPGLVHSILEVIEIPVIAMARPRSGDFVYANSEWEVICKDVTWLTDQGVDGIAFGALDPDGQVHVKKCQDMRQRTEGLELVFHRAFDVTHDWSQALEQLVDCGIDRILTSGQKESAHSGIDELAAMVKQAAGRIEILPAAGIGSVNAKEIVERTGTDQIHGSFSGSGTSPKSIANEIRKTGSLFV